MRHAILRPILALALSTGAALPLGGCQLAGFMAANEARHGTKKVEAAYTGLRGHTFAVVVQAVQRAVRAGVGQAARARAAATAGDQRIWDDAIPFIPARGGGLRAEGGDAAGELVAHDERRDAARGLGVDGFELGAANAGARDLDEDLIGDWGLGARDDLILDFSGGGQDERSHRVGRHRSGF